MSGTYSFYQHLNCILSCGSAAKQFYLRGEGDLSSEFSTAMMALDGLTRNTMMFMTREFNPEVYEMFEGLHVRSRFESFIEENLTSEEYSKLNQQIFRIKHYG